MSWWWEVNRQKNRTDQHKAADEAASIVGEQIDKLGYESKDEFRKGKVNELDSVDRQEILKLVTQLNDLCLRQNLNVEYQFALICNYRRDTADMQQACKDVEKKVETFFEGIERLHKRIDDLERGLWPRLSGLETTKLVQPAEAGP